MNNKTLTREKAIEMLGEKSQRYANAELGNNHLPPQAQEKPKYERTGIPAVVEASSDEVFFANPVSGLVGNLVRWDEEKRVGEYFFGRAGQQPNPAMDAYESDRSSVLGVLNVLRSFIIDEHMHYSKGILTRYPELLTGTQYSFRKGATAYVKGWAIKHLKSLPREVVYNTEVFIPNRAYECRLNENGTLWVSTFATDENGSKTAAEGWKLKFMVAAALESGTGIRLSVGPDTKGYAEALGAILNGTWQLENNTDLNEIAVQNLTQAILEIQQDVVKGYWQTVNKKKDYVAQKGAERRAEKDVLAPNGPILPSEDATVNFNGEQVHVTADLLRQEIAFGRPIMLYARTEAALEDSASCNYMDLRRQPSLKLVAISIHKAPKLFRKTVEAWK